MAENHKFYCMYCLDFIKRGSLESLCLAVNEHNATKIHKGSHVWHPSALAFSAYYYGPGREEVVKADKEAKEPPEVKLLKAIASTSPAWEWGTAEKAPKITEADNKFLKGLRVRWM